MTGSLKTLLGANLERVTYPDARLLPSTFQGLSKRDFVPLADVPDYVWKTPGGPAQRKTENPSHFADMDKPLPDAPNKGKTLLDLCADPQNVTPEFWKSYYGRVHDTSKGTLPFRVRQVYEEMVAAAAGRDVARYVAAAGILAHYVGDACQPLHISYLFNGDPDRTEDGATFGKGVHGAYEASMINAHGPEILAGVSAGLAGTSLPAKLAGGQAAALATVDLMSGTFQNLKPMEIVDAYAAGKDLWSLFGPGTITTLVQGVRTLAGLWQSAWEEGNGDGIPASKLGAVPESELVRLYGDPGFLPSLTLDQFVAGAGGAKPKPSSGVGRKTSQTGKPKKKS